MRGPGAASGTPGGAGPQGPLEAEAGRAARVGPANFGTAQASRVNRPARASEAKAGGTATPAPAGVATAGGERPFLAGERVLLVDSKSRRHLLTLREGAEFHTHAGSLSHDALLGLAEGSTVRSSQGARYLAVRPTLAEVVLEMPRGAQVIYPKDLGPMLILADVFPGARILEAGLGSGALSMALLRAGAEVTGYELRPEFAERALANVASFLGEEALARYHVEIRDVYEGTDEVGLDRVVLDLPEPWRALGHAAGALRPGGIIVCYLPTVPQVMQLREALARAGFVLAETVEVLHRPWHVDGLSVRPEHRMVAHTGFLTAARLAAPGQSATPAPAPQPRPGDELGGEAAGEGKPPQ